MMTECWTTRFAVCLAAASLACSLCACSSTKPVRRAATVTAAGAAAGTVVTNQAKDRAVDAVTPNLNPRDRQSNDRNSGRN